MADRTLRSRDEVLARLTAKDAGLATVSGILTTRPGVIRWADEALPELSVITTKSYQRRPNPGNREPILCEDPLGPPGTYGNAVGLRNPGMEAALAELSALGPMRALLNVSLAAGSVEDFEALAARLSPVADLFELNLSCPHATDGSGTAIGTEPAVVREVCRAVRAATRRPFLAKLTPNTDDIGSLARAALEGGADGIAAINTTGPFPYGVLGHPQGLGGRSGAGIRDMALRKIAEVRAAIGPGVPLIGMGGVGSGEDVRRLREAGAGVVGLGSVLARVGCQERLRAFVAAIARDAVAGTDEASPLLDAGPAMRYTPYRIAEVRPVGAEVRLVVLDGRLDYEASQYAFLYIPGVGEKPFSMALGDPLSFVVRKRGPFTEALWALGVGDTIHVRGPYGAAPETAGERGGRDFVLAGGTGIAVAPELVRRLLGAGRRVSFFYGVSRADEQALASIVPAQAQHTVVADDGRPGRVLAALSEGLAAADRCWNIGPPALMRAAAAAEEAAGVPAASILLSLETPSLCGVGVCGLCEVGGRLLCRAGTFVTLQALRAAGGWEALGDEGH